MKKIISLLLAAALTVSTLICVSAEGDGIEVYLEGNKINFDVPPQTINDRTMVPIRAIFEAMGATVYWDETTQTAVCTKGGTTVKMTLNSTTEYINGNAFSMDAAPVEVGGRTLAPARYVAEAFGYNVDWDEQLQRVLITANAAGVSEAGTSTTSFEMLKSIITAKGEKRTANNDYCFTQTEYSDGNVLYREYIYDYAQDEVYITTALSTSENNTNALTILFVPQGKTKGGFVTEDENYPTCKLFGEFLDDGSFKITDYTQTENPLFWSTVSNMMYKFMQLTDKYMAADMGISFKDLGLSYKKV